MSPPICTGLSLVVSVPSPSRPLPLLPHAHSVPSLRMAMEWPLRHEIDAQLLAVTRTGESRSTVVPSPILPLELFPQPYKRRRLSKSSDDCLTIAEYSSGLFMTAKTLPRQASHLPTDLWAQSGRQMDLWGLSSQRPLDQLRWHQWAQSRLHCLLGPWDRWLALSDLMGPLARHCRQASSGLSCRHKVQMPSPLARD